MKLEDIKSQLVAKQRSIQDLLRFIKTRTDCNPNYTLLLGAGCSVSSGVRPATALCELWRKEIIEDKNPALLQACTDDQREWLKKNENEWYDSQREYSTLFEKKYDLQRQRRMFVENEVKNATPSIGYAYLMALVQQEYFNTLFTTNFDDLLNEAFFLYSKQRPIVCAHDSSINSVTVTSKRPKIIKLHGDYLFDDIKATDRETESLGQNMKEKFIEFAKDFGLIVIGYAGSDRSIIDVLTLLLKNEEYFRNGIYWCIRKGSDIPEDLRRLFWKDRVYFVEIDGFDELFAQMYSDYNNGDCLPPAASQATDHYDGVIKKLLSIPNAFPETSDILKRARERMTKQSKRKAIASLLVNPEQSDRPLTNSTYTDDELLILTNLQRLQRDRKLVELVDLAKSELDKEHKASLSSQIATFLINSYMSLRKQDDALRTIEQQDKLEPLSTKWLLQRARILGSREEKSKTLMTAKERNDESAEVYRAIGAWHREGIQISFGEAREACIENAGEAFKKSLQIEPSRKNAAWSSLYLLYLKHERNKSKQNSLLNELEVSLANQGSRDWRLLSLKTERMNNEYDKLMVTNLLSSIEEAKKRVSKDEQTYFDRLQLKVHQKAKNYKEIETLVQALIDTNQHLLDAGLATDISKCLRESLGKDRKAASILKENLAVDEFDSNVLRDYISVLLDLGEIDEAESVLESQKTHITHRYEIELRRGIAEGRKKYSVALQLLEKSTEFGEPENISVKSYILLLDEKFEEAKRLCQTYLESINFSPYASVEIINYELARKLSGQKPDASRLDRILAFDGSTINKAVISALRDHKKDSIEHIKLELRGNKSFRYDVMRWPVFSDIRNDSGLKEVLDRLSTE